MERGPWTLELLLRREGDASTEVAGAGVDVVVLWRKRETMSCR